MKTIELCLIDVKTNKSSLLEADIKSVIIHKEARFSIPADYQDLYVQVFGSKGIDTIYGLKGEESITILQKACKQLDNRKSSSYWYTEEGRARLALHTLISLAKLKPDCVWSTVR